MPDIVQIASVILIAIAFITLTIPTRAELAATDFRERHLRSQEDDE